MNKVSLNFAEARSARWPLALLVGAIVAAGVSWTAYTQVRDQIDALSTSGSRAEERELRKSSSLTLSAPADLPAKMAKAQQILNQLTLPWDDLFAQLESVKAEGVTLLALEPDADRATVTLSGEAVDVAAMLTYIAHLEQAKSLSQIHLQRHEVMVNEAAKPVRFTVGAKWKPSA